MEGLTAPFIATTNLTDRLDPATQRRFTLRDDFKPLTRSQATTLFERRFGVQNARGWEWMDSVTPGDVAVVTARAGLLNERGPEVLLHWLPKEVEARGERLRRTGFHDVLV